MEYGNTASISGRLRGSNSTSPEKSIGSNSGSNRESELANLAQSPTTKIEGGEEEAKVQQISDLDTAVENRNLHKRDIHEYSPINLNKYRYG